jgi:anti-sigma regulatory factor (Ser/Thr protein kinase)
MTEAVHRVLAADLVAPSVVRRLFTAWLAGLHWPAEEAEDLVLAVSEAVSNVVDHAYPDNEAGDVVIDYWYRDDRAGARRVVVRVGDHGAWRPPPTWHENRRRGLRLMRACTESMDVWGGAGGTVVELTSRPALARRVGGTRSQS